MNWLPSLGLLALAHSVCAAPSFGPAELVTAADLPLMANGYTVPAWADWDGDGLPDLILGEGGGATPESHVRLYLNQGAPGAPLFGDWSTLAAGEGDLHCPGSG